MIVNVTVKILDTFQVRMCLLRTLAIYWRCYFLLKIDSDTMRPVVSNSYGDNKKSAGVENLLRWCGKSDGWQVVCCWLWDVFVVKNRHQRTYLVGRRQAGTKESEDCTLIITEGHLAGESSPRATLCWLFVLKGKDVTLPQKQSVNATENRTQGPQNERIIFQPLIFRGELLVSSKANELPFQSIKRLFRFQVCTHTILQYLNLSHF